MAPRLEKTNIDIHLIRLIVTVLKQHSVSRAAKKLQATQPTLRPGPVARAMP